MPGDLLQGTPMTVHDTVLRPNLPPPSPAADIRSLFRFGAALSADTRRVALVGTFTPRKCGIATFTNDVFEKLAEFHPDVEVDVYALDDPGNPLAYDGVAG